MNCFWNFLKDLNNHYGVILGAIATLIIAFIAVFNDKIKAFLNKPKIKLKSINFTNDAQFPHITYSGNNQIIYFHLKIINLKHKKITNCQIRFCKIKTYLKNKQINDTILDVPVNIVGHYENHSIDIVKNESISICYLKENLNDIIFDEYKFWIYIKKLMENSDGYDLYLEILSDNYYKDNQYYIKIRFNKLLFDFDNIDDFKNNFSIELIEI